MDLKTFIDKIYYFDDNKVIKSDKGRCLIIGGSYKYIGAPILASDFALLSGVGYTSISLPSDIYLSSIALINKQCIREILSNNNHDDFNIIDVDIFNKYDSILFGNGVLVNDTNKNFLHSLIKDYMHNLIIDASGLEILSKDLKILFDKNLKNKILLTPHIKELTRLLNCQIISKDPKDYLKLTIQFVKTYHVNVLIKSYYSILVSQDGKYYISTYNGIPILGHASSGDMLSGFLSGLITNKSLDYLDAIFYGDELFHLAALKLQQATNKGILDSKELIQYIKLFIKNNHN